jgi:hypothetical protein
MIDDRTRLVRTDTTAICRRRASHHRRFLCVVHPPHARAHEGLYIRYDQLNRGRFRIHWLYYRKR